MHVTDSDLSVTSVESDDDELQITSSWVGTFLYPKPADRTATAILKWWERRRLPFNVIVGSAGLVTVTALVLVTGGPPASVGLGVLLTPIAVYAVMANVCFSAGSVVEMLLNKIWGRDVLPVGPALWRAGLIFSVGLTLVFPLIILVTSMVLAFFAGLF